MAPLFFFGLRQSRGWGPVVPDGFATAPGRLFVGGETEQSGVSDVMVGLLYF